MDSPASMKQGDRGAVPPPHRSSTGSDSVPRYQPLLPLVCAVTAGIALDRQVGSARFWPIVVGGQSIAFAIWWSLAGCSLALWWLAWRWRRDLAGVWLLLLASALVGASWHHARWHLFGADESSRYASHRSQPACVLAVVCDTPERVPAPPPTPLRAIPGSERTRMIVDLVAIRDGTAWRPASGICQVIVEGHLLGIVPGDRVRAFGQLEKLRPPMNPGEFDFSSHARTDRQMTRLRSSAPECVTVLAQQTAPLWRRALESMRLAGRRLVREYVGPDRAGLAGAILLGSREGLTTEDALPYLSTGSIHVLVVSGLNVAILASGLFLLMRLGVLSRRTALATAMIAVILYAALAEAQPPVVRAAVLATLMCVGAWIGRRGVAFNSLAGAALVVLAINPGELFRPGAQLSFLAVAALIWVGPPRLWESSDRLDQMLAERRPWYVRSGMWSARWVGWLVITSAGVWLVTLPLVLHQFHLITPIAVLISPAVWLVVFVAMWSGFGMLVVSGLFPAAGRVFGWVCSQSLAGLDGLVRWADSVPGGHFWSPGPATWWVLGFYLGLFVVMVRGKAIAPLRWQVAVLCGWVVVGVAPSLVQAIARDSLECSFVSIGHGACVVLETPSGQTVVYDAGALGSPEYATQTIAAYLWHRGIRTIDGLVISHADVDHYNAVPGLLERFRVGAVYVSPVMFEGQLEPSSGLQVLYDAIHTAGVPLREIWSGDRLRIGDDLALFVLHPSPKGVVGTDNANSVTLAVESAGRRVLLPGDLESPGLEDVMAELPYDCDVLLAPHHGSRRSDPPGFAAWSTPNWVVISGGGDEEVAPVVRTYADAGATVFQTNLVGAVRFSLLPNEIMVDIWRGDTQRESEL